MTRETKIGLLVGLAFIIVIGILLSDHMTSSTDPPPAVLTNSANSVRDTIRTPGGSQPQVQPITVAPQVSPQHQVLTQGDLDAQQKAQAIVRIGPAPQSSPGDASVVRIINSQPQPVAPAPQGQPQPPPVADNTATAAQGTGHPIERIAAQFNEPIVSAYPPAGDRSTPPGARTESTPSGVVEYTAQAGDSLSCMAAKLLGANTKANRDAIVRANPSLQANPDKVVVGKSYRIPSAGTVAAAPATPAPAAPAPAAGNQPAAGGEFWYTVKEGDTLTRIAREQLGLGDSAIPALVELNRDTIKNPDSLQINSRIRLPGRPVAQIN